MTGSYQNQVPLAERVDVMGGAPLAPNRLSVQPGTLSAIAGMGNPNIKPNFFGQGGTGRHIAGIIGDALIGLGGGQPVYARMMQERQAHELDDQIKHLQISALQRKAGQPNIEHIGDSVGILDPDTGGFTPTYTAPTDAERYATAFGETRGSPGWMKALQDYTLKANGPTSFGYREDLEGDRQENRVALEDQRQGNRVSLEGVRQGNRASLRATPTYGQLHPRIPGGVVGGRGSPAATIPTANLLKQLGG